jgi:hypothetical protein
MFDLSDGICFLIIWSVALVATLVLRILLPRHLASVLILLFVGAAILTEGACSLYFDQQIAAKGVRVLGTVDYLRDGHGRGVTYYAIYHYDVGNRRINVWSCDLAQRIWSPLTIGGPIPLKYLPDLPEINRMDFPEEYIGEPHLHQFMILIGMIFIGMGIGKFFYSTT